MLKLRLVLCFCIVAAFAALGTRPGAATGEVPPIPVEDIQVLVSGPIHEAFAEAIPLEPEPGMIVPKAPPALIEEIPPAQKPAGKFQWIPGYWAWDDEREGYIWVSGIWRAPPPDRQWVPGYWNGVTNGYQWVSGYWTNVKEGSIHGFRCMPGGLSMIPSMPINAGNIATTTNGKTVCRQNFVSAANRKGHGRPEALINVRGLRRPADRRDTHGPILSYCRIMPQKPGPALIAPGIERQRAEGIYTAGKRDPHLPKGTSDSRNPDTE